MGEALGVARGKSKSAKAALSHVWGMAGVMGTDCQACSPVQGAVVDSNNTELSNNNGKSNRFMALTDSLKSGVIATPTNAGQGVFQVPFVEYRLWPLRSESAQRNSFGQVVFRERLQNLVAGRQTTSCPPTNRKPTHLDFLNNVKKYMFQIRYRAGRFVNCKLLLLGYTNS